MTGPNDQQESEHFLSGVCEFPVNLMLGPVICTPLLERMSIQLQFTLGNTDTTDIFFFCVENYVITFYPAMTAFTDQYSLPNIFFDIGQLLIEHFLILVSYK